MGIEWEKLKTFRVVIIGSTGIHELTATVTQKSRILFFKIEAVHNTAYSLRMAVFINIVGIHTTYSQPEKPS